MGVSRVLLGRAPGNHWCLIGDSGTGKSHLLIGLGTAAAEHGYRVHYTTAAALVSCAQRTNISATLCLPRMRRSLRLHRGPDRTASRHKLTAAGRLLSLSDKWRRLPSAAEDF